MNHYTNKKSLAQLGHGKWKSALGHTLLIIGMVLVSLGAFAQNMTPVPDGLKMEKKWVSDDPTGRTGNILVEAFVTGHSVAQHVPTDIVLVLDVSGSMDYDIGNTDDYYALGSNSYSYNSYGNNNYFYYYNGAFRQVARERTGGTFNRRYNLHFNVGNTTYYLSGTGVTTTNPNVQGAGTTIWTGVLYRYGRQHRIDALKDAVGQFVDIIANDANTHNVEHRISIVKYAMASWGTGSNESTITEHNEFDGNGYNHTQVVVNRRNPATEAEEIKTIVNSLRAAGATASDYGMNKARYVLASIPADQFEERNKVVVMFTDGSPTHASDFDTDVATDAIGYAHDLKHSWNTYQFDATVFTVGVFDNVTGQTLAQVNQYMNYVSSNYPDATSFNNGGTATPGAEFYFKAESAGGLADIFEAIAGASGAMSLPASAIVQDMVSPNFQMPEGASGTVIAYAPKCTDYDEATGVYTFEDINDAGELTIGTITVDGEQISGVVTGGNENMLPANFITVNGKTIQMSGFNFSYHWCGWVEDDHGNKTINGRKIVIKIPVEVQGGTWGDGIQTNDPAHSYIQVGDTYYGPFNNLTTNVMGDVWTEIVTSEPQGYNRMDIDTPEELAWFISEVNGRIHYNGNTNNVASNTALNGKLTADIDMSAHNWVPIGAGYKCNANNEWLDANGNVTTDLTKRVKLAYEGTFDGNGHVITGLKNNADKWYKVAEGQNNEVVVYPGMFSNVKGTVHDVFILDSDFRGKAHQVAGKGKFIHHGILADTLTGGTIYNCEAAGRMTCNDDNDNDVNLIYGGLVGLNNGGTIYNSMAMAKLTGYTMGGAIGDNHSGSFKNGFTNGEYHYLIRNGVSAKPVGGLAATNAGTIDNCYVRFERDNENLTQATFNMLVGSGTAATNCYIPQLVTYSRPSATSITTLVDMNPTVPTTVTTPDGNPENSYTLSVNKTFYNMFTNDNMTGGTWGTLGSFNVYENGTPLVDKLNALKGTGAEWKRTTAGYYSNGEAGDINEDYPVLQLPGYTCLASTDGISIDYAHNLSDMLHRHNSGALNENTALGNSYKVTDHAAINGGAINLYVNDDNRSTAKAQKEQSTDANVVVYIDENISLLQDVGGSIEAYTGQTLQAYNNTETQAGERWHNISSSLSNSEFGWSYGDEGRVPSALSDGWDAWADAHDERDPVNPCLWNLNNHDEDQAFYPIDLSSYHRGDFYCFYEPEYHWINFRRNSSSHWHMDDPENDITYTNEDHFLPGKGYLVTIDMSTYWSGYGREAQFVQNRGTLNNGTVPIKVTCTDGIGWTGRQGYNLLGNPYQSYLDFDAFVSGNADLLGNSAYANTYAVYDPASDSWLQYKAGGSPEGNTASPYINMHQGFFIQVNGGGTANFTNDMRTNTKGSGFRGNENHYPLVNFTLTDNEGNKDIAVLEVSRPENDGAKKIFVSTSKGRLSLRHDNEDFAILFRDMQSGSQPLYFEAKEDGTFTLSWNTANANFSSLTLVDNLTGVKYDMLANDSYTFQGSMSDYRSRFKVVFGAFTDVEENEETVTDNFAFFDGSDWIVNGQGQLTVTDMTGRTVYTNNLTNDQNRVSLNGVANGIYLMRVANGQNVNVQKIVVR